jgi:hypothetical protein
MLRDVVLAVADGLGLRLAILSTPGWIQRAAVWAMDAFVPRPLPTPAPLQMLAHRRPLRRPRAGEA